jgi:hypothetical protein
MSSLPFVHRDPTVDETERLRLAFSTFRDGSGMLKDKVGGGTWPGWRDFERAIAAVLGGDATEDKQVFDVLVPCSAAPNQDYGISVKSHIREPSLKKQDRVYIELSNANATFWDQLVISGIPRSEYGIINADNVGNCLLSTVTSWCAATPSEHLKSTKRHLILKDSIYLSISCDKGAPGQPRVYHMHSFGINFPPGIKWSYLIRPSAKKPPKLPSLHGYDPSNPLEKLFSWHPSSGGQLKWYPRTTTCLYSSAPFSLQPTKVVDVTQRAARCFPKEWLAAKGTVALTKQVLAEELEALAILSRARFTDGSEKLIQLAIKDLLGRPTEGRSP